MKFYYLLFLLFYLQIIEVRSQGCSDAGFCTMGSLHPADEVDSSFKHNAKLSLSYGSGEQKTSIIQIIPEIEFGFFKNNTIQVKIPYIIANGDLGSNKGIGDLMLSLSQKLVIKKNSSLTITIGTRLPTGSTDVKNSSIDLPMPYQTGLGTYDLILGSSLRYKKWNLAAGYQAVIKNQNKNEFAHFRYMMDPVKDKYFESNLLDRGDDVLLKIEGIFHSRKFGITPGLLGIYRLQEDMIVNEKGNPIHVKGSKELTLNLTCGFQYELSKQTGIHLLFGTPVIVRETRSDGLTRELVLTLMFNYQFGK